MQVNEQGNYVTTLRLILVNQKKLNYFKKIIFISYFNISKQIFEFQYESISNDNIIKVKDWQKEKGIFIAAFNRKEETNHIEDLDNEITTYEEIIRIGLKISPNAIKDEQGNDKYNIDEFKVTDRDLIEYLRNGCCEGNVYTPKADFHINLPKVFNKMSNYALDIEKSKEILDNNEISQEEEENNNNTSSNRNTKRVINDMYWDLGWIDSSNFIYYETSVFFDIEQKPKRLSYYEFWIEFLQSLIDKKLYNSLFDYFCFNLSILTRGDRYLAKKIFGKKIVELNDFNSRGKNEKKKEELYNGIQFISNILCGYDEDNNIRDDSISFNLLKKKVSSNIKNFID